MLKCLIGTVYRQGEFPHVLFGQGRVDGNPDATGQDVQRAGAHIPVILRIPFIRRIIPRIVLGAALNVLI